MAQSLFRGTFKDVNAENHVFFSDKQLATGTRSKLYVDFTVLGIITYTQANS